MDQTIATRRYSEVSPETITRARGNREAFGELYDHYLTRVYAFCWLYSRTREEAEDLTALTFERALKAIHRYEDRGAPFSAWLLQIAANAARDRARRVQRDDARGATAPLLVEGAHSEEWLAAWEDAFWLRGHVSALPADQREVVRLRFFEDYSFPAIAGSMERSEGAVKQLLRRALRALLAGLEHEMGAGDV